MDLRGIVIKDFPLNRITSFKTGGPASIYYIPNDKETFILNLREFIKNNIKFYIIGNGTNILVSDKGVEGIVINLKGFTNYIIPDGEQIICGAGISMQSFHRFLAEYELTGLENLYGIPGTIGGALVMNAGAFGTEIGEFVEYVKIIKDGEEIFLKKSEINFSYRNAEPVNKSIVLEAGFKLKRGDKSKILAKQQEIWNKREEKQPLEFPSAGSVFKRPMGDYAGRLIEQAGCKGLKIGGAMVSEKHANFIINTGNATSEEIFKLINIIREKVYENSKVLLEPEIKFWGFTESLWYPAR